MTTDSCSDRAHYSLLLNVMTVAAYSPIRLGGLVGVIWRGESG